MATILEARDLTRSFGAVPVLERVSLAIEEGNVTAVTGCPGSGKSMLVSLLTGYLWPDSGQVFFGGEEITGWPPTRIAAAGLARTFLHGNLFEQLTVADHLILASRNSDVSSDEPYAQWRKDSQILKAGLRVLSMVGLTTVPLHTTVRKLSLWSRKQLDLALALVEPRRMVIWEEPTSGLGKEYREEIHQRLDDLRELGKTILFTTRDPEEAIELADSRIDLELSGGRSCEDLAASPISQPAYR
jgi:branched-chain amino acid transport system ATP-binding protein